MKKALILLSIFLYIGLPGFSQGISGEYSTTFQKLTLQADGTKVIGSFENNNGALEGTFKGNRLTGTWTNSSTNKKGKFEFIFNSSFTAFTGTWNYNNAKPSRKWNGTKIAVDAYTSPTQKAPDAQNTYAELEGSYSTTFKTLILKQEGDIVSGTFEDNHGTLTGTFKGNRLTGTWTNSSTNKNGKFEFIFNASFTAFKGTWNYNDAKPSRKWNGTKIVVK